MEICPLPTKKHLIKMNDYQAFLQSFNPRCFQSGSAIAFYIENQHKSELNQLRPQSEPVPIEQTSLFLRYWESLCR